MAAGTARYFGFLAVGIGSMLAGAAVTHQVFKPKLDLRPLDAESQRRLEEHRAAVEAEKQALLDAIDRGDSEEMQRLIKNRMPAGQSKYVPFKVKRLALLLVSFLYLFLVVGGGGGVCSVTARPFALCEVTLMPERASVHPGNNASARDPAHFFVLLLARCAGYVN